jgi:hypothetical protein
MDCMAWFQPLFKVLLHFIVMLKWTSNGLSKVTQSPNHNLMIIKIKQFWTVHKGTNVHRCTIVANLKVMLFFLGRWHCLELQVASHLKSTIWIVWIARSCHHKLLLIMEFGKMFGKWNAKLKMFE